MQKYKGFILGLFCGILLLFPMSITSQDNQQNILAFQEKEKRCIIEALWYEARGESKLGIAAVLSVIQNRVNHKSFPKTYCKVIHQSKQFSYRNEVQAGVNLSINKRFGDTKYSTIQGLAQDLIDGTFSNLLSENTLYYSTIQVTPLWSKKMKKVLTIDNHKFFEKE